ncbi:MAG: GNAT family protein [Candidatus Lokiarchaeota archaeon]
MSEENFEKKAFTFIEGQNLDLIPETSEWAHLYAKWLNDPEVRKFARGVLPLRVQYIKKRFEPNEQQGTPNFVVMNIWHKRDKKPIGIIGLGEINWFNRWANAFIEIGEKDYWGKGIASEATELLLQYAFEELNLNKVAGKVIIDNVGSWKVAEKVGFRFEGILEKESYMDGEYLDVKRYVFLKDDWFSRKAK